MSKSTPMVGTKFELNGALVEAFPNAGDRLSQMLREQLGARDVKIGCNAGDCGACTVLLDGEPVCACLVPAQQAADRTVETLSGLHASDELTAALAASFLNNGAAQCGICTPGMMVAAVALLRANTSPSEQEVQDALAGVLCRCTGYRKIIDSVLTITPALTEVKGHVGEAIQRIDGQDKVAGREAFGDDVAPPGTLEIFVIRTPFARSTFKFGDLQVFVSSNEGLIDVLTATDVPGRNLFGVIPQFVDQPVFAEVETRFRGEAVAAVIGTSEAIQNLNPETFPVDWTELVAVTDVTSAQMADAGQLHEAGKTT